MDNPILAWRDVVLYPADLHSLADGGWLTDSIIEFHCEYLEDLVQNESMMFLRPLLVTLVTQSAGSVKALEPVMPAKLGDKELVFLPVNDGDGRTGGGTHWSLVVFCRAVQTFYIYDSMGSHNYWHANKTNTRFSELFGLAAPLVSEVLGAQQSNSSDCGVLLCSMIEELALLYLALRDAGLSSEVAIKEAISRAVEGSSASREDIRVRIKKRIYEARKINIEESNNLQNI
ncbi:hypothetical protein HDU86_008440 [Geranomyces michiganensis]|nr:hypothetical protein HDU86_008440 [Geranomyces michiganensis]